MTDARSVPRPPRFTRRSATFIGSFTLAARIVERLGAFGQIALIASIYGSSFVADRYFIASIVPVIIGAIAGEALSSNIMPALVRRDGDPRLAGAGFWLAALLLVLATLLYLAVAAVVVRRSAPAGSSDLGVWIAFAPLGPLLGLGGYLSGVLTYLERYVWPPFRSAVATVGAFALTLVALAFTRDLVWIAVAVSGGYALSLASLAVEVRRAGGGELFRVPRRAALADAGALARGLPSPVVGGLLGGQIFVLLERALAASLGVGAVATLSYARGIVFTPVIVAQAVALGIYPATVRAWEANELAHVRESVAGALRVTLFAGLGFAVVFAVFGREAVGVLLERGAFDPRDAASAGTALAAFSLGLVGSMLMVLFARVFYAVAYFRAVVWAQAAALVVYLATAVPLRLAWGTTGLAVAFGVAEVGGAAFALVLVARRLSLPLARAAGAVADAAWRVGVVAAAVVAARVALSGAGTTSPLLRVALGASVAAAASAVVLWTSDWPELARVKRRLRAS